MTADPSDTPAAPPPPAAPQPQAAPRRPLLRRLFGLSLWGGIKLVLLCILTGFIVIAANFDPRAPSFNPFETLGGIFRQAFAALGWALRNFWQPALIGATVVLPAWVLWRLVSLPFRK
jgi:hypothetical protein